tara:strand:+ start:1311 stop:1721 length:411 start_codon:yes stop_codon:yes gene_type:complete
MSAQPLNLYNVTKYTASKKGQVVGNYAGDSVELEYTFEVTDPAVVSTDTSVMVIPAGSLVESVDLFIKTTLSGGTNFTLGTAADADGLVAASTATTGYVAGAGALIGTALAADAQIAYAGSRTAGVIKVIVKYKKA